MEEFLRSLKPINNNNKSEKFKMISNKIKTKKISLFIQNKN
jgi:hypothetical protein